MTQPERGTFEESMRQYLHNRVSRARLLQAAGAGVAIALAGPAAARAAGTGAAPAISFPYYPQVPGTYTPENIVDVLNIADTAEHLAVTFLTAAIGNANTIGLSGLILEVVQAALAEEVYHVKFLEAAGARALTDSFSVPDPKMLTDFTTFFQTVEIAESIFIGAYMAATREFAEVGQPTLAKYAYQIGAVEAEHRTLARAALALGKSLPGDIPPNNKAFETDLFVYVRDAATVLSDLGFLGKGAVKATFPGVAAGLAAAGAMAGAVIQTTPNNAASSVTATGDLTGQHS